MKFSIFNYIILAAVLLISGFIFWCNLNWSYILFPFISWLIVISLASFNIRWDFFLQTTSNGTPEANKIALTFDDGPHPEITPKVLELLEKYNAKATFFCIGQNIKNYPGILQTIHDRHHTIGNHSFTHSNRIDFNSKNGWLNEINSTDAEIESILKKRPKFFRPPFGVTTPHLAKAIKETGHKVIGWDVRSFDTLPNQSPEKIVARILKQVKPGSIILLHDHIPIIVPMLEQLLPELQKRNFTFVTVDELINTFSRHSCQPA